MWGDFCENDISDSTIEPIKVEIFEEDRISKLEEANKKLNEMYYELCK